MLMDFPQTIPKMVGSMWGLQHAGGLAVCGGYNMQVGWQYVGVTTCRWVGSMWGLQHAGGLAVCGGYNMQVGWQYVRVTTF